MASKGVGKNASALGTPCSSVAYAMNWLGARSSPRPLVDRTHPALTADARLEPGVPRLALIHGLSDGRALRVQKAHDPPCMKVSAWGDSGRECSAHILLPAKTPEFEYISVSAESFLLNARVQTLNGESFLLSGKHREVTG